MTKAVSRKIGGGIESYLRRIFGLMTGAVLVTALTTFIMLITGAFTTLINGSGGLSVTYYIITFAGLGLSIWAQMRAFSMKPTTAMLLLFLYSIFMGIAITPMILVSSGLSIIIALVLAAVMFACMALFGYKTVKDLSFLGVFLFLGLIGLILVGIVSMFFPMGETFSQIVCLIGVLIFALFAAYDMQTLKNAYYTLSNGEQKDQLAVLGALHMYISFVAMFEYLLGLLNSRD
ncbi:MAG: Bax inhibitor-1/YccA family protein [Alphaproteobacteria bacterium]|nr:Bax inhibitor-1/YccA family protein [Alphaproteobacteria bacterium]